MTKSIFPSSGAGTHAPGFFTIAHSIGKGSPRNRDNSRKRMELAQAARQCLSKEGRVLARQLTRGIKIFTAWDNGNYIKGEPGDWLVMRKENHADQYVITGELFPRLYRPVSREMN